MTYGSMPWIGPDSRSRRAAVLLTGTLRMAGVLVAAGLRPGAFLAAFLVLTAFFLLTFSPAAGFFCAIIFFLTAFFTAGFLAARFLLARLLAADFLASAFLFATFFLPADFFAAGFFRAIALFADVFFFVTSGFFPAVFFLVDGLLFEAFLRDALAGLRLLLAVFFAGIFNSYRSEKNAQLYIAYWHMEARISRFFCRRVSVSYGRLSMAFLRLPDGPRSGTLSGSQRNFYAARDHRFMLRITLHYPEFTGMGVTPADAT